MAANRIKGITIEIGGDTSKLDKALSGVNKTIKDSQSQLKDLNKLLKLDPGNTELLQQKYNALTDAINATKEKLETLKTAQEQAQKALEAGTMSQSQYDALQREIIETEKDLEKLTNQYNEFGSVSSQKLQKAGKDISEFGDKVTNVGKKLSVISAGVAAVGGAGIAAAKELDEGYDTIITKTGATGDALADMQQQMNDVFSDIPTTAEVAGTAIGEVNTRFGATGDELEELSKSFIKFAEINGTDLNTSIDSVDSVMTKFGVDSSQVGEVLGLLTKAGQDTGLSMDSLQSALEKNGAAFKEMGFGLTESVNLLAMLESNGVDSSTAMAGLKKAVANATKDGLSADEALRQTISSIKEASSDMEALEIATELFGSKGAPEMAQAIREGRFNINDLSASLSDYATVVDNTFNATQDPWDETAVAMNNLKVAGAELGSALLTTLQPAIKKLVEMVKEFKEWFVGLDENQKQAIVKIGLVVAAIGPLVLAVGKLISIGGSLVTTVGKLLPLIAKLGPALAGISAPVVAVVAVIGTLIAAFVHLWNTNEEFRNNIIGTWENIKAKFEEFGQGITERINALGFDFENISEVIKTVWEGLCNFLGPIFEGAFANIEAVIDTALDVILDIVDFFISVFTGDWKGAFEAIQKLVSDIWDGIKKIFQNSLNAIDKLTNGKLTAIGNWFKDKFDSIKKTVGDALDWVKDKFDNLKLKLPEIKLPHFKIDGELSLNPPSVPSISIDWYKKAMNGGMILNSPTIFGASGGKLLGAGEAGPEAVVGVGSLQSMIQNAVGSTGIDTMVDLMSQYLPYLAQSTEIRLDSGALVGATAMQMNNALGRISSREGRR